MVNVIGSTSVTSVQRALLHHYNLNYINKQCLVALAKYLPAPIKLIYVQVYKLQITMLCGAPEGTISCQ